MKRENWQHSLNKIKKKLNWHLAPTTRGENT
jgi:hypothetical protein